MLQQEPRDDRDTIAEIEEAEIEAEVQRRLTERSAPHAQDGAAAAAQFASVMAWCLEADSVAKVGLRLHIVAAKLNLGMDRGKSYAELAELMGFRRTAAHKLGNQFTAAFGVKGPHDRTEETRRKYSQAYWRSRQGQQATPEADRARVAVAV